MRIRAGSAAALLALASLGAGVRAEADLERGFEGTVRPFVARYCVSCHSGAKPPAQFDISAYTSLAAAVRDNARWTLVGYRIGAGEMPPKWADALPTPEERRSVVEWVDAMRREEARKRPADPGVVLARRLSNAEYNYSIHDLTGVDIQPAREFPVDPANPEGFDNSGESLAMSPALLAKYLQAAREVADHLVFKPDGLAFAPHPMLVETDRDRYCVKQIIDFYGRQATDYGDYFRTAWLFRHRAALGRPKITLAQLAAEQNVSPSYLASIWHVLAEAPERLGPLAGLQALWRELPGPRGGAEAARAGCERMRDFVVRLRKKTAWRYAPPAAGGLRADGQPLLMWRNRQYAAHRTACDPAALQVEGEQREQPGTPDPDLKVPAGQRRRYEAAFARFCAVFPDAFYVSERGRYFPDATRDKGRHLSAGFHNTMGYFRDDLPLYELLLDEQGRRQLDALWHDLDFVASATARTYVQFYLNESGEARPKESTGGALLSDAEIASEPMIARVAESHLAKLGDGGGEAARQAVREHFAAVNAAIRWAERARVEAEPRQVAALQDFAALAYRRPLSQAERDDLAAFYRSLRDGSGLAHEEAIRDCLVGVLMAPDFCYRLDLLPTAGEREASAQEPGAAPGAPAPDGGVRALSDYALASRLSYFLWSGPPDAELLAAAAAGTLRHPDTLVRQARRMATDPRARRLATEFGGHWLGFRRFEQHNAVDRERFKSFDDGLRRAMFEEPIRFLFDVVRENRSVLDLLHATHTFVNPALAKHYGMPDPGGGPDHWVRVEDADRLGRGGLLPMAVFLTMNAPGLRTSPVKRGYWVVKQLLGEVIPPPPAVVPEIVRDETKLDLPVRDALARHRQDQTCAACHSRFDAYGLVFEGYGPVGEKRSQDLAGRPVDDSATFPAGDEGSGLAGLRRHLRERRQDDFVDNLSRKLLAYALGRSLIPSDDLVVEAARARLSRDGYRIHGLVESIVTSPQFLNKRRVPDATIAESMP